jgi:hypothetical protein
MVPASEHPVNDDEDYQTRKDHNSPIHVNCSFSQYHAKETGSCGAYQGYWP